MILIMAEIMIRALFQLTTILLGGNNHLLLRPRAELPLSSTGRLGDDSPPEFRKK
jgi:hypothetical protein